MAQESSFTACGPTLARISNTLEASLLGFKFYVSPFFKLDSRTFELRKKSSVVFAEILPLFNFILNFGIFEYQKKFGKYIRK